LLVTRLEIQGGEVRAESVLGAGIGSRSANVNDQQSRVDTIQVRGGKVTASSLNGSGIGSGRAASPATSSVRLIDRSACDLRLKSECGAGIGSGHAISNGNSTVEALTITCANVRSATFSYWAPS
jgi:hypothetical protein